MAVAIGSFDVEAYLPAGGQALLQVLPWLQAVRGLGALKSIDACQPQGKWFTGLADANGVTITNREDGAGWATATAGNDSATNMATPSRNRLAIGAVCTNQNICLTRRWRVSPLLLY